jgi:xanthine dehydrogenase small subunit
MTRFVLNSRIVQTDQPPGTILLDFIRLSSGLTGTKEACREGECGACTVLLGRPGPQGLVYRAVASCLLPLGDVQGCHVVTVEGLSEGPLTLVQEMILEHSASQCGFCTPGVVMSLTGFCLASKAFSFREALDALDGNLCRCTGYVAIRDAARALCERLEGVDPDPALRVATLVELGILPQGFLEAPSLVDGCQTPEAPGKAEAIKAVLVAGGTDIFVQRPEQLRKTNLEFLSRRQDLKFIRLEDGVLRVGGAVTVESFRLSEVVNRIFPTLRDDLLLHSSTILRNRATLTGNLVNASPVGDVTIILLALDATLEIRTPEGQTRRVRLAEFYRGYKQFDLAPGELITEIRIPEPAPGTRFNFEKVSNREILDIAAVNTAMRLVLAPDGTIQDLRLSAGGVAPVPLSITGLEGFRGRKPEGETLGLLARHVVEMVSPISDIRGSATYKKLLLGQLVRAHFSAEVLS